MYRYRTGVGIGFTARHDCRHLVYFEVHEGTAVAIQREKQIKKGARARELALIEGRDPTWRDIYDDIV